MSDDELLRTLAALRERYLAEAPERIHALQAVLARIEGGERAALADLRHLLHRLAGSGGAYGLDAVTDTARAGEAAAHTLEQLNAPLTAADMRGLADRVAAVASAFREAGASI